MRCEEYEGDPILSFCAPFRVSHAGENAPPPPITVRMATRRSGRDSSGHVDPYFQRRKRYQTVLRTLGLDESFMRMPRLMQELFFKFKSPDGQIEFDDSFP